MPQELQKRGSQASKLRLSLEPAAYGHLGSATARLEALPQGHTPKRSLRVGLARHPPSFGALGGLFCWAQARREAVKRALSSHVRATTEAKASKTFVGRKQLDRNSREFGRFNIHCLGACKRQTQHHAPRGGRICQRNPHVAIANARATVLISHRMRSRKDLAQRGVGRYAWTSHMARSSLHWPAQTAGLAALQSTQRSR